MKKLLFIVNPNSGKGLIKNHLLDITDKMTKAGFLVTLYLTQKAGDAREKVKEEGTFFDRICCCGGDGTLSETAAGMIDEGLSCPLGYIPGGSTNDFANSLGLPKNVLEAAEAAVGEEAFPCDIGLFNGTPFLYVAAFGLFTDVSYETPQEVKNVLGHAAYVISGARSLFDISTVPMTVTYGQESFTDDFVYGMVTNSYSVGGFSGITGPDVLLDDGVFEGTFIKKPSGPAQLNEIRACLMNDSHQKSRLVHTFHADRIKIVSEKTAWTLDGEFGGEQKEAEISVLPKQISFLTQRPKPKKKEKENGKESAR